jgi:SAM-dependent methyltransferase
MSAVPRRAGRIAAHVLTMINWVTRAVPVMRAIVPVRLRRLLRHTLTARAVRVSPDRLVLERVILPEVLARKAQRVLSVGVEQYTAHYPALFAQAGVELWTVEIDPYHARWGEPGRHVTGDVRELRRLFVPASFDVVLFNGIIGFGIDDVGSAEQAISAVAAVLKPDGWLVLGWNIDKGVDPLSLTSTRRLFTRWEEGPLPSHMEVPGTTHVYDQLRRVVEPAPSGIRGAAPSAERAA